VSESSNKRLNNPTFNSVILHEKPTAGGATSTQGPEKNDKSWEEAEKQHSLKNKLLATLAGVAVLAGGGAVGLKLINGGEAAPQGTETSAPISPVEQETVNQTEALQDRINARPEMGSSEYLELFKDIKVPYVEGQSPEDVVQAFIVLRFELINIQFSDAADMSLEEKTRWAIENDTETAEDTAMGIIEQLDLSYYASGVAYTLYGSDGSRSEFGKTTLPRNLEDAKEYIAYALQKNIQLDPSSVVLTDTSIISSGETDIYAETLGYYPGGGASAENPNYGASMHLQVVKKSDSETNWYLINNASDSNG